MNQNFARYGIGGEISTISVFTLDYFQKKLMLKFSWEKVLEHRANNKIAYLNHWNIVPRRPQKCNQISVDLFSKNTCSCCTRFIMLNVH